MDLAINHHYSYLNAAELAILQGCFESVVPALLQPVDVECYHPPILFSMQQQVKMSTNKL